MAITPIQSYSATKDTGYQAGFALPSTPPTVPVNYNMGTVTPTTISNQTVKKEVPEIIKKSENLGIQFKYPIQPTVPQNTQVKDYTNAPFSTRDGQNYYFNENTQNYDIPDGVSNTGLFAKAPYSLAIAKNIEGARKKNDQALASSLEGIKNRFEQYRTTQKNVTTSGAAGASNALLQSEGGNRGSVSQFAAATSDARVDSIMKDGQLALQELDNKEKELISSTQSAYAQEDFKYVDKLNSQIEKLRTEKLEKTKETNKKLEEEAKKQQERETQASRENSVSGLVSQGITDPAQLLDYLNNDEQGNQVGDFTLKEVQDAVAALTGLGGSGIIGEYNYYKSEAKKAGITPVDFNTYQNQDANRKAVAQGLGGVGLTGIKYNPAQSKYIDTINEKISKNPTYQTTNKMKTFIQNVQTALNQENGMGDIAAINQFQKIIDEGAVTRDQDVVLLQGAQSLASTLGLKIESLRNGDKLSDGQREQMRTLINEIYDSQIKALESDPYVSTTKESLKRNGIAQEDTIIGELSGFSNETTGSLLNMEKNAEADFASLKNNPPDIQTKITNRYNDLQTILGRPPTASEYFEANPWDRPKKSARVSAITDTSKGLVGGINLKGYATDPNQIKAVATLYEQMPDPSNTLNFDKYIKSSAPKSKITGEDIVEASSAFKLDPKVMLALMQHESKIGTSTVALANNNFGGITWSESYAKNNPHITKGTPRPANEGGYYVKFATPLDGLMAQAKLLSNRKIA